MECGQICKKVHSHLFIRFRVLKTSLDKSFLVYNSVYEESVFTSEVYIFYTYLVNVLVSLTCLLVTKFMKEICCLQMCLMKANMKMLQDKLLKEMVSVLSVCFHLLTWLLCPLLTVL